MNKLFANSLLVSGLAMSLFSAQAASDAYKPYKGETLVVSFPAHPHFDAVKKVLPEFTKETGIKVEVDQLDYLAMRQKQTLELSKPKGDYDLLAYVVFSKADYVNADQIYPLAPFFLNPKLADPSYHAEDLVPVYAENIGMVGGKKGYLRGPTASTYGIPFGAETSVLAYRKDIFAKHNLKVPETYDELVATACKIHELEPSMVGFTSRGASGHQINHAFLLSLDPLGGKIFDDNWNYIANNKAGIKTAETLKKLLSCSPKGVNSFGFGEAKNAFLQGKAAMYLDSTVISGEINDPSRSKVAGKVAFALHPKGVKRGSETGGFGLAIPKNGNHPKAAFLLLQWLTSPKIDKEIALAGGSPSRLSTYNDADVNAKYPYIKKFGQALQYADPDWRPIIPVWNEIENMIGVELSRAISGGGSVKEALDKLKDPINKIMTKAGYHTWDQKK
ncbi:MAG: extracellular solute-binding protein [Ostreibacterium sp.]